MSTKIFVTIFWLAAVTVAAIILKLLFSVTGVAMGLCIMAGAIAIATVMIKKMVDNFHTED